MPFYIHIHTHIYFFYSLFPSLPFSLNNNPSSETWKTARLAKRVLKRIVMTVAWIVLYPISLAIGMESQKFPFPTIGFTAVRDEEKFYLKQTTKTHISPLPSPYKTTVLLGLGSDWVFSCFLMHLSWIEFLIFESNYFFLSSYLKVKTLDKNAYMILCLWLCYF